MNFYEEGIKNAKLHNKLYHYTNKEGFEAIQKNGSLLLRRLDKVNDPKEDERIIGIWKNKIYVACFTYEINDQYFIDEYGSTVRLEFDIKDIFSINSFFLETTLRTELKKFVGKSDLNNLTDWCWYDKSILDICYTDNVDNYKEGKDTLYVGILKQCTGRDNKYNERDWTKEKETRLRLAIRPVGMELSFNGCDDYIQPKFEELFCRIPPYTYTIIN